MLQRCRVDQVALKQTSREVPRDLHLAAIESPAKASDQMARKTKSKINKSNAIREIKAAHPEAGPTEIASMIKSQFGVDVTPATVSTVLSTDKKRNGKVGRPGRPKGSKNNSTKSNGKAAVGLNANQDTFIQNLIKAKQLVNDMGGISEARNALNALESLMSAV